MKLRTEIFIPESEKKITHHDKTYFSGSCFSENIASKMKYYGFDVLSNSHGILFNPVSIKHGFMDLVLQKTYRTTDLRTANDIYFSYAHHGSFNSNQPEKILEKINGSITEHAAHFFESKFVIITLGSSWVYETIENKRIAANCHKQPSSFFNKRLLSLEEITDSLQATIELIGSVTKAEIIFTLSPVKHLKDGFIENQHSKSLLHIAIQKALKTGVSYFPAYEIMMDDLRDYRFWSEDMVHPNELAINYIWEKFSGIYFDENTNNIMKDVNSFRQLTNHRSLSSDPKEIEDLKIRKEKAFQKITNKYPHIKIDYES